MSAATMADVVMPMGLPCGRRVPKGNLRWYLLRVPEGREQSVCDLLKRIIPRELLEDAFAPRKERWAKRGGAWGLETVRMYRGYAFAATRDVSGLAKALARTTAAAELVGEFGRSWMPLAPEAQGWLEAAMDGEHVIRNSVGVIQDGVLHVQMGPLVGQEARVSKVDRHKRRCFVRVCDGGAGFAETMPLDVPSKS